MIAGYGMDWIVGGYEPRSPTFQRFFDRPGAEQYVMAVGAQELGHAVQEDRMIVDYRYLGHHIGDLGKEEGNLIEISEFILRL